MEVKKTKKLIYSNSWNFFDNVKVGETYLYSTIYTFREVVKLAERVRIKLRKGDTLYSFIVIYMPPVANREAIIFDPEMLDLPSGVLA